jgi:hypothetical protein
MTEQVMAHWIHEASDVMKRLVSLMRSYKETIEVMKNKAIADKRKAMNFQEKLIELKDEQLSNHKTTVQSTVVNMVEKEIKSHIQAVTKNTSGNGVSLDALKSAVKNALKEEDRSKDLVKFGLIEEEKEQLENIVGELLSDLGEKSRISVNQIGIIFEETKVAAKQSVKQELVKQELCLGLFNNQLM